MSKRKIDFIEPNLSAEIQEKIPEITEEKTEEIKSLPRLKRTRTDAFVLFGKSDSAHVELRTKELEKHNHQLQQSKGGKKTSPKVKPGTRYSISNSNPKILLKNLNCSRGVEDNKKTSSEESQKSAKALLWGQSSKTHRKVPPVPIFSLTTPSK